MAINQSLMSIARWYGPADALTGRLLRECHALLVAYRTTQGATHVAVGAEIVRRLKKLRGWRSPYSWFSRTNVRGAWVLASYHHRAQSCWEWSLWLSFGRATRLRSWNPRHWYSAGFGQTTIGVPWLFTLSLHRQSDGWMLSGDAEQLIRTVAEAHGLAVPPVFQSRVRHA